MTKAIRRHGVPENIPIDGRAANKTAIERYNEAHGTTITLRPITYRNHIVEQDHRAVKRMTRPMLGCTSFHAARRPLVGIELMHMLQKNQLGVGPETKAALRSNCSTPWRPKPPPDTDTCPCTTT